MKLNDKIQKAIEETVNNAVDAVCERVEWVDQEPEHTSKMKTALARKVMRAQWEEYLTFNEAIANELELDKASDWLPECPKAQLEGYIAYLQGMLENTQAEELEWMYS